MNSYPSSSASSINNSSAELELPTLTRTSTSANDRSNSEATYRLNDIQLTQDHFSRFTGRNNPISGFATTRPSPETSYLGLVKAAVIHSLQNPDTITAGFGIIAGAVVGTVIPSALMGYMALINQSIERIEPNLNNINPSGLYNIGSALVNRSSVFCTPEYIESLTERGVCEQTAGLIKELVNNGWMDEVIDGSINQILKEGYKEFIDSASSEFSAELENIKDGFETYSGASGLALFAGIAGYAMGHALTNIIFKDTAAPLLVKLGDYIAGKDEDEHQYLVELDDGHRILVNGTTLLSSVVGAGLIATACHTYIDSLSEIGTTSDQAINDSLPYLVTGAILLGNFLFGSFIGTGIHNIVNNQMRGN